MKNLNIHYFDYYVLLFFCLSFFGWLWEVLLYLFTGGVLVNRGVYYGPYLPVYGIGGILLMLLLHAKRKQPVLVFIVSPIICTAVEYAAATWLEQKWGVRWWDYSDAFMNVDGKICLLCSIGFGIGGVLLICMFQPLFHKFYHRMTRGMRIFICIALILIFVADAAYSIIRPNAGKNITCIFVSDIIP
jgi:Predicted membrane protein